MESGQEMELVMAYVDGELDIAAQTAFEARLREDAGLRQRVETQQGLRAMLGASFAPVIDEPIPLRLQDALKSKVVSLDEARGRRRRWPPSLIQLGGIAASLVIGLLIGQRLPDRQRAGGSLQARGELVEALDSKISGEQLGGVTLGLSFVAKGGAYCRSFATQGSAGLACREGEIWQLKQLVPAGKLPNGDYRTAASAVPPALLAVVDEMREGDVLDARQEMAARASGWAKRRP